MSTTTTNMKIIKLNSKNLAATRSCIYMEAIDDVVLEFLRTHDQFDYSHSEIAKCLKLKYGVTVHNSLKRLAKKSKVTRVRLITKLIWTWQLIDWINDAKHDELNRRW